MKRLKKLTLVMIITLAAVCFSASGCSKSDEQRYAWPLATASPEDTVTQIYAVRHLLTCELNLVGIDDDNVVTTIYVGSKAGLILAAEELSDLCGEATEDLVRCIHNDPLLLCCHLVNRNGLVT